MKSNKHVQDELQTLVKNVAGVLHELFGIKNKIDLCLSFKHPNEPCIVLLSNLYGEDLINYLESSKKGVNNQNEVDEILRIAKNKKAHEEGRSLPPDKVDKTFCDKVNELVDKYYTKNSAYIILVNDIAGPDRLHSNLRKEEGMRMLMNFVERIDDEDE